MARAEVREPGGKVVDAYERRDEHRALLTARAQSSNPVPLEGGGFATRWRWPVGSTVWVDGRLALELRLDGWRDVPAAPAPPAPATSSPAHEWGTE